MINIVKLLDYVASHNRRLVSPVGGGSADKFLRTLEGKNIKEEEKIARWLNFQNKEYGHDFLDSGVSYAEFCSFLDLETYIEKSGFENVVPGQIKNIDDIKRLKKINYSKKLKESPSIKAIKEFKKMSNKFIGGGCFGPITITSTVLGIENFLKCCIKNPELVEACAEFFYEILMKMAYEYEKAGADYFLLGEPTAVMVSPKHFRKYSGKYTKRIFSNISIPGFIHIPGDSSHLIEEFVATGAQCLSIDFHVDTKKLLYTVPRDVVILGNINTISLLKESKEEIEDKVQRLNVDIKNFQNYVVSSGGGIIEGTSDENLKVLFDVTRKFPVWSNDEYLLIKKIWDLINEGKVGELENLIEFKNPSKKLLKSSLDEMESYLKFKVREIGKDDFISVNALKNKLKMVNKIKIKYI